MRARYLSSLSASELSSHDSAGFQVWGGRAPARVRRTDPKTDDEGFLNTRGSRSRCCGHWGYAHKPTNLLTLIRFWLRRTAGPELLMSCGKPRSSEGLGRSPGMLPNVSGSYEQELPGLPEGLSTPVDYLWWSVVRSQRLAGRLPSMVHRRAPAESEIEGRTLPDLPLCPRLAAVTVDDALDGGEPDAGSRELGFGV
jgi:hypothetical protein